MIAIHHMHNKMYTSRMPERFICRACAFYYGKASKEPSLVQSGTCSNCGCVGLLAPISSYDCAVEIPAKEEA